MTWDELLSQAKRKFYGEWNRFGQDPEEVKEAYQRRRGDVAEQESEGANERLGAQR